MEQRLSFITDKTAVLIVTPINRRYLTGFPSSLGYLLMTVNGNTLFVDGRYFEAATKKAVNAKVVLLKKLDEQLNSEFSKQGIEKVLIETENEIRLYQTLKKMLNVKVTPSGSLSDNLLTLRSVKRTEEIESIIEAQKIAERAFDDILNFIKVGITEKDIAAMLEFKMKSFGAENIAFDSVVVSGENSSMPHGTPSDKKIENGDFITFDFGAVVNGYVSDMTRTVAVGHATDEMIQLYNTVLTAQKNAIESVREGALCADVDAAARKIIEDVGYGEYFGHATGHGVGLAVHEKPNLSMSAGKTKLLAGQIVTAEPGIYIPGKFGVRIEDMILVSKNGCKNLTKAPKHLIIL